MPESGPSAAEERLAQPPEVQELPTQEIPAINFSNPEHGQAGHICTPECQKSQAEANDFSDDLFKDVEAKLERGEVGQARTVQGLNSQVKANKLSDELFSDNIHQKNAAKERPTESSNPNEAYETAKIAQSEIAVPNKQAILERQDQAQQIILSEIARSNEASGISKQAKNSGLTREAVPAEKSITGLNGYGRGDKQTQRQQNKAAHVPMQTASRPKEEGMSVQPVSNGSVESVLTGIPTPSFEVPNTDVIPEDTHLVEAATVDNSDLQTDGEPLAGRVIAGEDNAIEPYEDLELAANEEFLNEQINIEEDDKDKLEYDQPIELFDGVVTKFHSATEAAPIKDDLTSRILLEIPRLEPIKQQLPAIVDTLRNYYVHEAKVELAQVVDTIDEILILIDTETGLLDSLNPSTPLIRKRLEILADTLGLEPELIHELLQAKDKEGAMSSLAVDILHGLKKLISVEYSLEFTKVTTVQNNFKNKVFIRQLGKLLIAMLSYSKRPIPQLQLVGH